MVDSFLKKCCSGVHCLIYECRWGQTGSDYVDIEMQTTSERIIDRCLEFDDVIWQKNIWKKKVCQTDLSNSTRLQRERSTCSWAEFW